MKLYMYKNHPVIKVNGHNYIIDTGSPVSFNYYDASYVEIEGKRYPISNTWVCSKTDLNGLTESDIDGLIGLDILRNTGMTFDFEDMSLVFSCGIEEINIDDYCFISFDFFMDSYIVTNDIFLETRLNNVIIDTGAPVPYISARLSDLFEKSGEKYRDFSPEFGILQGEYLHGTLVIGNGEKRINRYIKVGKMPQMLDMFGIFDAIVGITPLANKRIIFDFNKKRIAIS